jgi:hypothetical protein
MKVFIRLPAVMAAVRPKAHDDLPSNQSRQVPRADPDRPAGRGVGFGRDRQVAGGPDCGVVRADGAKKHKIGM